jgi:hypothetical protein
MKVLTTQIIYLRVNIKKNLNMYGYMLMAGYIYSIFHPFDHLCYLLDV